MANFGEMRSRIADELANDGDVTSAQINNAIISSIRDYEGEAFWFNEKVATFQANEGQELYGVADLADIPNIVSITSMRLIGFGGPIAAMSGVDNDTIDDVQDGTVTGSPRLFSRYTNQIRLYPIPNAAYTVKVSYIYKFATLSDDSDTNAWTEDCEELIRQAAKKRICIDILHADDMAARFALMEKAAYDSMRKENRFRQPQKQLRTEVLTRRRTFNIVNGW